MLGRTCAITGLRTIMARLAPSAGACIPKVPTVSAYIRALQAAAKRSNAALAAAVAAAMATERSAGAQAARERLTPLADRLARLLATIPDDVKREGLSLPALVPMLRGRWRAEADAGQLGTAFRELGWRRERKWRGRDVGFKALWFPPGYPLAAI